MSLSPAAPCFVMAAARVVERTKFTGCRIAFCRPREKGWTLMKICRRIKDIAFVDGRFCAIGKGCELYVFDLSPPIIFEKFKLRLPAQFFEPKLEGEKRISFTPDALAKSGGDLKVYGYCEQYRTQGRWMFLELEKLHNNLDVSVLCEGAWWISCPPDF